MIRKRGHIPSETKFRSGFTLVELLVVISIIGILSAVVYTNLNSARIKAKYSVMQQNAIALYPGLIICRDGGGGTGSIAGITAGFPICNPDVGVNWPTPPLAGWVYGTSVGGSIDSGAGSWNIVLTCVAGTCDAAVKTCTININGVNCS